MATVHITAAVRHSEYYVVDSRHTLSRTTTDFFISTNEQLMYKFYKNCNYFIFK